MEWTPLKHFGLLPLHFVCSRGQDEATDAERHVWKILDPSEADKGRKIGAAARFCLRSPVPCSLLDHRAEELIRGHFATIEWFAVREGLTWVGTCLYHCDWEGHEAVWG